MAKVALPTAAALGAGAAVAIGSIGGGNGTITACYGTDTVAGATPAFGAIRLIDPSLTINGSNTPKSDSMCTSGEGTLDFNQSGPPGLPGANGAAGAPGTAGAPGAAGAAGPALIGNTTFGLSNTAGLTFMKLEGISGPVTDKHHKDQIEINSFSFGASNAGTSGNAGSGALTGRRQHQTFSIVREIDAASPKLFQAASSGQVIEKCDIFFAHKFKGSEQDFLEVKMTDVVVSGVKLGVSSGGRPSESVSFTFSKASEGFVSASDKSISPQVAVSQNG